MLKHVKVTPKTAYIFVCAEFNATNTIYVRSLCCADMMNRNLVCTVCTVHVYSVSPLTLSTVTVSLFALIFPSLPLTMGVHYMPPGVDRNAVSISRMIALFTTS